MADRRGWAKAKSGTKLCYRRTFIDVEDGEHSSLSPRPSSEPSSECSSSLSRAQAETAQLESLSQRMAALWGEDLTPVSTNASAAYMLHHQVFDTSESSSHVSDAVSSRSHRSSNNQCLGLSPNRKKYSAVGRPTMQRRDMDPSLSTSEAYGWTHSAHHNLGDLSSALCEQLLETGAPHGQPENYTGVHHAALAGLIAVETASRGMSSSSCYTPQPRSVVMSNTTNYRTEHLPEVDSHAQLASVNADAVFSHIRAAASRITYHQRLSAAIATIEIIPEQFDDVLQHNARYLAHNLDTELSVMLRSIRHNGIYEIGPAAQAVSRLEAVPEIILTTFEDKMSKVKGIVRSHVNGVIKELEGRERATGQVIQRLWSIPEDIEQMAGDAVEEAVQESKVEASRQFDMALQSLPWGAVQDPSTLTKVRQHLVEQVPELTTETMRAARATAEINVEHAIAAVGLDAECLPNTLVSDALLRVKVQLPRSAASADICCPRQSPAEDCSGREADVDAVVEASAPVISDSHHDCRVDKFVVEIGNGGHVVGSATDNFTNPGSTGHPELCCRPCQFFRAGPCPNSDSCRFCHQHHEKRSAHLGRQHRKLLEEHTLGESLVVALPVLYDKFVVLGLPTDGLDVLSALDEQSRPIKTKDARSLERALRSMPLKTIFLALRRAGISDSYLLAALDDIITKTIPDLPLQKDISAGTCRI